MEDTGIPKIILNIKPEGRLGRPKLECLHDVEVDIKTLRTKRWRQKRIDECYEIG
jgi:hypothetical protein